MPTYDFSCDACGTIFEQFLTLAAHESTGGKATCQCGQTAEQVILPRRNRARYAYLKEFTYFESADGHVIPAGNEHDTAPNGYIKKSTGLINEMRKLSKKMDAQDRAMYAESMGYEDAFLSEQLTMQHRELRAEMEGWDDVYKETARIAMEDANKRPGPWNRSGEKIDFGYLRILE